MLADPTHRAYAGAGPRWAADAGLVYETLARHLVARCPVPFAGRLVLDAGAGTGAAGAALVAIGARVIESDVEPTMLDHHRSQRPPGAAADIAALPFRARVFDVAVAAFVLNHVADPAICLSELARVTRPGGIVLASTFGASRSAVKEVFDASARRHGWHSPGWHEVVNARAGAFSTMDQACTAARRARLVNIRAIECAIDTGIDDPESIVRYRLGMPQYAAWLDALDGRARGKLVADAVAALAELGEPFRPRVVELIASVS